MKIIEDYNLNIELFILKNIETDIKKVFNIYDKNKNNKFLF